MVFFNPLVWGVIWLGLARFPTGWAGEPQLGLDALQARHAQVLIKQEQLRRELAVVAQRISQIEEKGKGTLARLRLERLMAESKDLTDSLRTQAAVAADLAGRQTVLLQAAIAAARDSLQAGTVPAPARIALKQRLDRWEKQQAVLLPSRAPAITDTVIRRLAPQPADDVYLLDGKRTAVQELQAELARQEQAVQELVHQLRAELNLCRKERPVRREEESGEDFIPVQQDELYLDMQTKQAERRLTEIRSLRALAAAIQDSLQQYWDAVTR